MPQMMTTRLTNRKREKLLVEVSERAEVPSIIATFYPTKSFRTKATKMMHFSLAFLHPQYVDIHAISEDLLKLPECFMLRLSIS